jgi:DNA-binding PadR family transcriptional regulator
MSRAKKTPEDHIPLTPRTFHILLALMDGAEHGYAIMKEVEVRSDGRVRIGPGTLYEAINRLVKLSLLKEVEGDAEAHTDRRRRRFYELTPLGREVMRLEAERLASLVGYAEDRKLIGQE